MKKILEYLVALFIAVMGNSETHTLSRVQLLVTPWNSPGKNIGVDRHSHLQGIFLSQGWNPGLLHGRQILYYLSHQERP